MAIEVPWDGEASFAAARQELEVFGVSPVELAKRIIKENTPVAALSMVHLAKHAADERIRLQAARFVIETGIQISVAEGVDPLEALVAEVNG